jgi:hypothetical protein
MPKINRGLCLYNIEKNGCLNGVYTNDDARGVIFNEIAQVHPKGKVDPKTGIADRYNGYYFDTRGVASEIHVRLLNGQYELDWVVGAKIAFKGKGYLMNPTQLVVQYWST